MNDKPLVSMILATYNRASAIPNCLDSILKQTYTNWELIVIDDSPEKTKYIVAGYLHDTRIKYLFNDNKIGLQQSRNAGIKIANGDLMFTLDDDLIMHPTCLEYMVNTYIDINKKHDKIIIVPRLIDMPEPNNEILYSKEVLKKDSFSQSNKLTGESYYDFDTDRASAFVEIGHANCLYSMGAVRSVSGYAENVYKGTYAYEDIDLNMRLKKKGYQCYFESIAICDHHRCSTGGCRVIGRSNKAYYYIRNHIVFVTRHYGIKSVYMIPCFALAVCKRIIVNNVLERHAYETV